MTAEPRLTPMFRQYRSLKQEHPDSILLFRMGDFYEMFYEDAQTASGLLQLTLTTRGKGTANAAPMCGFPHHQLSSYTSKLVKQGQRVAVCDQVEDPKKSKGLVKREVVEVVTPGTLTDPDSLESKANQWICAIAKQKTGWGVSFADVSTGEWVVWESNNDQTGLRDLLDRLRTFNPCEILHAESVKPEHWTDKAPDLKVLHTARPDFDFSFDSAKEDLKTHFRVKSLDGFGLRGMSTGIIAGGALLAYLKETQKTELRHFDQITRHEPTQQLHLDPATRRNLELDASLRDQDKRHSLFQVIDQTCTAGGGRMLRKWMHAPLLDQQEITARLDAIQECIHREEPRRSLRERLGAVKDIERLLGRCVTGKANPRDIRALANSLMQLPDLFETAQTIAAGAIATLIQSIDTLPELTKQLAEGISEEPPVSIKDGGVIRDGYEPRLDALRDLTRNGKKILAELEHRERERTQIQSLKVKYNKVFGYFIEVSKTNLSKVPEDYERKQTLANAERFVTPELKTLEEKILSAQEESAQLEEELFKSLRQAVAEETSRLKTTASMLSQLDALAALAETAVQNQWSRPQLTATTELVIEGGRHPVVEQTLLDHRFVPNDCKLDGQGNAIGILTGPNMGGKSTFLRQTGLIVLLAHMGSFVPAESASIGLVDRIFCRVGASDHLAEGQSTFMVEMTETANILHHATHSSLVLLDEIGRGTATFDGLSIAWAVVEQLHHVRPNPPRTLFATHYHELTELALEWSGVRNLRMAVKEWGEEVVFLHRVEEGAADRSYGIQVARLAGMPSSVVERAAELLKKLEHEALDDTGRSRKGRLREQAKHKQARLFERPPADTPPRAADPTSAEVLADLRTVDVNQMTPMDALSKLNAWKLRLTQKPSDEEF